MKQPYLDGPYVRILSRAARRRAALAAVKTAALWIASAALLLSVLYAPALARWAP